MARRPWIKLWVEDWDRSTALMTLEERGAYIRLITQQWSEGFIPSEPRRLALLLGVTPAHYDAELRDMVEAKFPLCEDGNRRNHRVEVERDAATEYSEQQSNRSRKGTNKRLSRMSAKTQPDASPKPAESSQSEKREERRDKDPDRKKRGDAPAETVDQVFAELNEARKRVNPGATGLKPTKSAKKHIGDRLAEGHSPEDLLHVIAVCEAECRRKPESFEWFNAATPFRPDNFQRKLGAAIDMPRAGPAASLPKPVHYDETREEKF